MWRIQLASIHQYSIFHEIRIREFLNCTDFLSCTFFLLLGGGAMILRIRNIMVVVPQFPDAISSNFPRPD
jgi:hypothetical protein